MKASRRSKLCSCGKGTINKDYPVKLNDGTIVCPDCKLREICATMTLCNPEQSIGNSLPMEESSIEQEIPMQ